MGSAASVAEAKEEAATKIGVSSDDAWLMAADISGEEAAKQEIMRLRALAAGYLVDPSRTGGKGGGKGKAARAAVMDAGPASSGPYTEKVVKKDDKVKKTIEGVMKENILFKNCKAEESAAIVKAFEPVDAGAGETIIKHGEKGDHFYVIESGVIDIFLPNKGEPVGSLKAGMGFGELALMYNTPRAATCKAQGACKLWRINRNEYRSIMTHFQNTRIKMYVELLQDVVISAGDVSKPLKDCLTKSDLEKMADALDEEVYGPGDIIIRQGEAGDYFYIIKSGECSVLVDGTEVAKLAKNKSFGEKALLSEDTRAATIKAISQTVCLALEREDFVQMLGSVTELISGAGKAAAETAVGEVKVRTSEEMTLKDLNQIKVLGHGAFGKVSLVKHNGTGMCYALKAQTKSAIVENGLQEHILMERQILMMLDHPFVLKLFCSLQDDKYVYFVLEVLLGGELFTWLRKQGRFEEPAAKFFSAQVVKAFEHMHNVNVAYRDLKPENLVLDEKGYLKVVDLGLAKVVEGKTWTLCGTPDYLAPEIILNEGHGKAVDYWALGVLIFELNAGVPPFYADDPMEVYEKILKANMIIPSHFTKSLADIVRKLLKLCQSKRLGNGKGKTSAVVKHKWFSGLDWDGLIGYTATPPIPISVKAPDDASNFDMYPDEPDDAVASDWFPDLG